MKNLSSRLMGAIVTMHLVFAYITGLHVEPFENSPWYIWTVIPVAIILGIGFSRLDPIFRNYKYYSLGKNVKMTAKIPWFWVLIFLSTLFVVGIIWYGGQALKPVSEIEYTSFFSEGPLIHMCISLGSCSFLYLVCIHILYKYIKKNWKS